MNEQTLRPDDFARFDPRTFAFWCRERWGFCALAAVVAAGITLAVSLAQPRQYTATAIVLIGAPAGNDPRATAAMNTVYLDSLKAWERVAASDLLFVQALQQAGMDVTSVAALKRRILRVSKPAGMALLEISVTLPDARQAQAIAQFIAGQTAAASRSSDEKSSAELNAAFREQQEAASVRLAAAMKARQTLTTAAPVDVLTSEMQACSALNARLQTEIALARAELAGLRAMQDTGRVVSAEARLASLEKQQKEAAEQLTAKAARLDAGRNLRETADAELKSARAALDTANQRFNEATSAAKFRGERLRVVDPGAVPREPSSPNVALNVLAALVVSLGGCFLYLAIAFGLRRDAQENIAPRLYSLR